MERLNFCFVFASAMLSDILMYARGQLDSSIKVSVAYLIIINILMALLDIVLYPPLIAIPGRLLYQGFVRRCSMQHQRKGSGGSWRAFIMRSRQLIQLRWTLKSSETVQIEHLFARVWHGVSLMTPSISI